MKMFLSRIDLRIKLIALILALTVITSCRSFGEFPAPRYEVTISDLTATQGSALFQHIAEFLHNGNFFENPNAQFPCLIPVVASSKRQYDVLYKSFDLTETSNQYVINVSVCINATRTAVMYQFQEIDPKNLAKAPPVFTNETCGIIAKLTNDVTTFAGAEKIMPNHDLQCETN